MMRKALTAAIAAITLGGAVCATAAPAEAQHYRGGYHGYYGGHYRHGNGGAAVAAGIAGLAIGAALASDHPRYYGYSQPYYGGYYGPGYYGTCYTTRWVWDPYVGHRVPVREAYAC
jgi:hypothetical protein